ncbi:MAG: ribulose-phosphate 3-epimerase [Oligosphaeraceae bacterium]|nr:ribulose-phosphate 3-epimerase [Oligosphaeraceae bacterium]
MPKRNLKPLSALDAAANYVAPSILAADFANLGAAVKAVENAGADIIHVDVMDGHFVPNLSMGPAIVKAIRSYSSLPFDVHLMLSQPARYLEAFAKAGADHITVHVESEGAIACVLEQIKALGCSAGLSLRPGTPAASLKPYLPMLDLVLVMSVEPGFGGQSFMAEQVAKMQEISAMIAETKRNIHLEVDGGIDGSNAALVRQAGCNMLVAGSSVFNNSSGLEKAIAALR